MEDRPEWKIPDCDKKSHILIAYSPSMLKILEEIALIAKSSASVFISGESGTGKEMIAQEIHWQSLRRGNPFIKVNCAALSSTLLESEFFGHEKGAFTGALARKPGRFELAHRGTLLLDEVSEISLDLQPKLLRVIQEREFERVGGIQPVRVDIRLIATSNRLMQEALEKNLFREDLYYRLNVIPIHLPPLRERREDILPLAEFFLKKFCQENQRTLKRFSPQAEQHLIHYLWPGNIRELSNVIERSVVMVRSECIDSSDLKIERKQKEGAEMHPQGMTLEEVEKRLILQTLQKENNNRTKTAQMLGISVRTLRNKLALYENKLSS